MKRSPRAAGSVSPRERVLLALNHEATDRVPMTLLSAEPEPPARQGLARHLGIDAQEDVDRYLDQFADLIPVGPNFRGWDPDYRGPALDRSAAGYDDVWGGRWEPISYGEGLHWEIAHYPLAGVEDISDLDRHRWPDPDWWDWSAIAERIAHARDRKDYALCMHSGNLWERTWWMRGFERSMLDMVDRPALFHAIM